jgi:hypothetical protein
MREIWPGLIERLHAGKQLGGGWSGREKQAVLKASQRVVSK